MVHAVAFVMFLLHGLLLDNPATASTTETPSGLVYEKRNKDKETREEKTEEEKRAEAEAERKRKEKLARVVVLEWMDRPTDYTDTVLQRNVRSRIVRPEAMFFPDEDLYQNGRKVRDRTVIPAMQPAIVPDQNIPVIEQAVVDVQSMAYNSMTPEQWGVKADEMKAMAERIWFTDRPELREPLFKLYVYIGYAAENRNNAAPPFYQDIGGRQVNYYWYLAAQLAYQEPNLLTAVTDQTLKASIDYPLRLLNEGSFPSFKIDFERDGFYDEEMFLGDYEIFVNGLKVEPDSKGQMDVFLGRTDIYFRRTDTGHGLSERIETVKLDESVQFVRNQARRKMGIDFIEQLFLHKNECAPEVDGDILNYLAIYQKLHDKAEIYIAVPEFGNPNRTYIWRYDRTKAQLNFVGGGPDQFPVRFAIVFSSGVLYNGAALSIDDNVNDESSLAPDELANLDRADVDLSSAMVPFNFELRMHYNRLMVNFGAEFGFNVTTDEGWVEYYQTPGRNKNESIKTIDTSKDANEDGNADIAYNVKDGNDYRTFNRDLYLGAGVVLGRDAGIGFGPRFAAQWGWLNMPHGWQTTAHFGWALQPPFIEAGGRVRPMIDFDLRGGVHIPRQRSLHLDAIDAGADIAKVQPVFGLNIGIGMTF